MDHGGEPAVVFFVEKTQSTEYTEYTEYTEDILLHINFHVFRGQKILTGYDCCVCDA